MMTQQEQQDLEMLVDAHGLRGVLNALSDICELKSAHIEENWRDRHLASDWQRASNRVAVAALKTPV